MCARPGKGESGGGRGGLVLRTGPRPGLWGLDQDVGLDMDQDVGLGVAAGAAGRALADDSLGAELARWHAPCVWLACGPCPCLCVHTAGLLLAGLGRGRRRAADGAVPRRVVSCWPHAPRDMAGRERGAVMAAGYLQQGRMR